MTSPYQSYRDSGVEWLGEVPDHWRVKRLRFVASMNDESLPESEDPRRPIAYVDIGSVDPIYGISETEPTTFDYAPARARRLVKDGDTILSTVRTYLRAIAPIQMPPQDMVVSTGFAVIRPFGVDPRYSSWALREHGFVDQIVARSTGVSYPAINSSQVKDVPIPLPPRDEQLAIASFLERETEPIDASVSRKQLLVERLQEYRSTMISRAVTRGLRFEAARIAGIDPSPRMKPSGVRWMGHVPEHWNIARLKWSYRNQAAGVWGDEPDGENDIACVRVADFDRRNLRVNFGDPTVRAISVSQRRGRELRPGDLLLEKSGGGDKQPVGAVVLFDHVEPAVSSNFISRIRLAPEQHPGFWKYVHAALYSGKLNYPAIKQTTGIQNLDSSAYFDTLVALPPKFEQVAIAKYLDRETVTINKLHDQLDNSVKRLQEYRSALISSAVTGKIDVREAAPAPVAWT